MRKGWRAVLGGVVGTFAMMGILLIFEVQTRARLLLFEALAGMFGLSDRIGLGMLVAMLFGIVVWPLVFVVVEPFLPTRDDAAVSGMLFATVLWAGFILLGSTEMSGLFLPFYLVLTLVVHLVYGFSLGLVYGWAPLAAGPGSDSVDQAVDGGDG